MYGVANELDRSNTVKRRITVTWIAMSCKYIRSRYNPEIPEENVRNRD